MNILSKFIISHLQPIVPAPWSCNCLIQVYLHSTVLNKMIRVYILQPTKHKAVRLLSRINFSKVQWEILISITLIIIELLVVVNPLPGNCVGWFFHLNTGINFGPNSLLFPRALEGGPITRVQSAGTPRFICTWFGCQSCGSVSWLPKSVLTVRGKTVWH